MNNTWRMGRFVPPRAPCRRNEVFMLIKTAVSECAETLPDRPPPAIPPGLRWRRRRERSVEFVFLLCACISILSVMVISGFIFVSGVPAIAEIGLIDFLFGPKWNPDAGVYGILPMIISSAASTSLAVAAGGSIGLLTAVFMAEIAPRAMHMIVRPAVELLAGIPSVVYGYFGLIVFVPFIRNHLGGPGNSLLAVIMILIIMILPTIVNISETALRAVPAAYREGSLALGASHVQTIFRVVLPAARSGIASAVVLGIGRAVGETMAIIMVAGNTRIIPTSLLSPARTLTTNIAFELSYATGLHERALYATGVVLFVFILMLNIVLNFIIHRKAKEA